MLLAIDTSTAQIGLALYDGVQVLGECVWHSGLHHTQELAPALAELLRRVETTIDQLHAIGVAIGLVINLDNPFRGETSIGPEIIGRAFTP